MDFSGAKDTADPSVLLRRSQLDKASKIMEQRLIEKKRATLPKKEQKRLGGPTTEQALALLEARLTVQGVTSISECGDYNNMDPSREL